MSNKRVWETKITAINHKTGELQQFIAPQYFNGVNYQDAHEQLDKSGLVYLQLTGRSYDSIEQASNINKVYDDIQEPYNLVSDMSDDEFFDWLSLSTDKETLLDALDAFVEDGRVPRYVKMIEGFIKFKYGEDGKEE